MPGEKIQSVTFWINQASRPSDQFIGKQIYREARKKSVLRDIMGCN